MQFTFQHIAEIFLENEWHEIEFTVTAQYTPASRGIRGPYGEPEEPDEAASVEILEVTDAEGNSYEWDEIEGIMGAAVEWVDENVYSVNR